MEHDEKHEIEISGRTDAEKLRATGNQIGRNLVDLGVVISGVLQGIDERRREHQQQYSAASAIDDDAKETDVEIVVNELDNKSGNDQEDGKPKQRVSKAFLQAMRCAVQAMTSEKVADFSARAVYSRMQIFDCGLAAPFDASSMSHGKRELQAEPHNLTFVEGSYEITQDCLTQLGKISFPIGNVSGKASERNSKKGR